MRPETFAAIRVKSKEEIVSRLTELIKRHRRKYLKRFTRACPENCRSAIFTRNRVSGCNGCGSRNPEICSNEDRFVGIADAETLYAEFSDDLRNPEVLLREYRDLAILLWVLGAFDGENDPDEQVIRGAEKTRQGSEEQP